MQTETFEGLKLKLLEIVEKFNNNLKKYLTEEIDFFKDSVTSLTILVNKGDLSKDQYDIMVELKKNALLSSFYFCKGAEMIEVNNILNKMLKVILALTKKVVW
jgi:predicted GTPase